jgi:hypothetical protein
VAKLRRRLLATGMVLTTLAAMLGLTSPVAAATGEVTAAGLEAHPGVRVIWKMVGGTTAKKTAGGVVAKTNDFDCADTATCIVCEVLALPPWPGSAPIINFHGEVHCYYPDQGYLPATVNNITLQVGLWDYVYGGFLGTLQNPALTYPPYSQPFVSQLGLTGAMPTIPASMCGSGVMQTVVFVSVLFGQCCPWDAIGEFGSDFRQIAC